MENICLDEIFRNVYDISKRDSEKIIKEEKVELT